MSKKIALGCTLLNRGINGDGIDGIGHYCDELLNELERSDETFEIERYSFGEPDNAHEISLYPRYPTYLLKRFLGIHSRSSTAKDAFKSADLIHATDHLIPIESKQPLLASIMDVIPISHPQFTQSRIANAKGFLWEKLCRRANHIITISEFSKREISHYLDYPHEQITVIPLGVGAQYFDKIPSPEITKTISKFSINKPFFLFIGSLQPRKNLARILAAHKNLPGNLSREFPLVVVGRQFWDDGTIAPALNKAIADQRCIWLSYVSDFEKRCLLQSSMGLVFASLYEGFGLPILEAFASGAPVISSNCTSMPEVAKHGALLVDPLNVDEIRNAMLLTLDSESVATKLRSSGQIIASDYTWKETANRTMALYSSLT